MEMRVLGKTGMSVSRYCLGAMMFGGMGNRDHDDCARIIHKALDSGINFIDTADVYSAGESETIVGKALKGRRDQVVLASKFYSPMGKDPNMMGGSRRWIMQAIENSLRRLGTDYIDLYQIHRFDENTDVEETLSALTDLQRQGKIRSFGSSMFPADRIVEAQWAAEARGLLALSLRAAVVFDLLARDRALRVADVSALRHGRDHLEPARRWLAHRSLPQSRGPHRPLASRHDRQASRWSLRSGERSRSSASSTLANALLQLAKEAGIPMAHMAMGFVLEHPGVTSAIIGPRTHEQLEDLLACADLRLDAALLDRIDALVPPGTNVNPIDVTSRPSGLRKSARRRASFAPR